MCHVSVLSKGSLNSAFSHFQYTNADFASAHDISAYAFCLGFFNVIFLQFCCILFLLKLLSLSREIDMIAFVFYFCFTVLVMTAVAFTSAMNQNTSEITCVFISQKDEGSGTPEASVSPKVT